MKWRLIDRRQLESARFVRDMIVASLVVVFSALFVWYSRYTGQDFWVYWAPFFLTLVAFAVGVPVYRAERRRMLAPGGMPPYRPLGLDGLAARLMMLRTSVLEPPALAARRAVGPPLSLRDKRLTLAAATLGSFVALLDSTVVGIALPAVSSDLGG